MHFFHSRYDENVSRLNFEIKNLTYKWRQVNNLYKGMNSRRLDESEPILDTSD